MIKDDTLLERIKELQREALDLDALAQEQGVTPFKDFVTEPDDESAEDFIRWLRQQRQQGGCAKLDVDA